MRSAVDADRRPEIYIGQNEGVDDLIMLSSFVVYTAMHAHVVDACYNEAVLSRHSKNIACST